MSKQIIDLKEDVSQSPLYSRDLAPVPSEQRTWRVWDLAAIWVGMAVCIPTYILASYIIKAGLLWYEALIIIGLANLLVTVPMVLNGHAGVKYGIPFPVLGRASFGISGIHIPAIIRGLVACGWFGIQTWIGGLAIYAIWCAFRGVDLPVGLTFGKFVGFAVFWLINAFFIWKGTESIRWLESFAAPILIFIGVILIWWGAAKADGFSVVLRQSYQLGKKTAVLSVTERQTVMLALNPLTMPDGTPKAEEFQVSIPTPDGAYRELEWRPLGPFTNVDVSTLASLTALDLEKRDKPVLVSFRVTDPSKEDGYAVSSQVEAQWASEQGVDKLRLFFFWLTAMVGFWATMSISIADITRYARSQRAQVTGQLLGLPGTMVLYSFVGVFVTCASFINFSDILIGEDAPWEPVTLLSRFKNPGVVILAQFFMLVATLSTNIAANVIAPANAFANAFPKWISFRTGGIITGVIGILIMPWWLLDRISGLLIQVSAVLGPVLGILVVDYFFTRRTQLHLADLFKTDGIYRYVSGFNMAAVIALVLGIAAAYVGRFVPGLAVFYDLSWFTGSVVSVFVYILLMKRVSF